jgi:hypothetical protein
MLSKITRITALSLTVFAINSFPSNAATLKDVLKSNTIDKGFVDIIQDQAEGKTYLKINNVGQQFIYLNSLPSGLGSNDIGLDRGQLGDTRLALFERAGNKVFLKQIPDYYRANTSNPLEIAAVEEAFASSVLWGFRVEDSGPGWVLVDASDFVLQDIHGVGRILSQQEQGSDYAVDKSRSAIDLSRTKAFPDNTELQASVTLLGKKPGDFVQDTSPDPYAITLKMHHSFIRLPQEGYQTRKYMPKSGYWSVEYRDYAQPINEQVTQKLIGRHRLHKQDPSADLSEAISPIIYYLDPGVPEPVRSALIDGAMWWNQAFESIGFKNAFQVKMLPADADPMDVRYNVIQWVHRATRGWSYGSSVIDPRTGEIIKGHVTLGSLRVRQDYLIAQGMMAPFAGSEDDQTLMDVALARIRQLSAHEVGHTLGINHNFAASNYGRESVMDYPHPLFEIDASDPNRIIAPNAYGVGIGKWDESAIAYGYQQFSNEEEENVMLKVLLEQADAKGLLYITDADARNPGSPHANASLWDNGADAVAELERMLQVRNIAIDNFGPANLKNGRNWSDLEEIFVPVYFSTRYQVQAAVKWLGGLTYDYAVKEAGEQNVELAVVGESDQNRALSALIKTIETSNLLIPQSLSQLLVPKPAEFYRTRESLNGSSGVAFDQVHLAAAAAQHTLGLIFNPQRLARIVQQNAEDPQLLSIEQISDQLHQRIVTTTEDQGVSVPVHQAVVDLLYSNYLNLMHNEKVAKQVKIRIMAILLKEKTYLEKMAKSTKQNSDYFGFYQYQKKRLEGFSLDNKVQLISLPEMPPGSPI